QITVVTQVLEILGIFLKMSLQLFAIQKLLTKFSCPCFTNRALGNSSESIFHTVAEGVYLSHVKNIRLHFRIPLFLAFDDLRYNLLVSLARSVGCSLVLPEKFFGHNER